MKKLGIFFLLLFVLAGCSSSEYWYAKIDPSKMSHHETNGNPIDFSGNGHLDYSYTLEAYNEKGEEKELTFGSSKELKDGHYVELEVQPIRGVVQWQEIQWDDLPIEAKKKLD